ncbi:MAG: cysteine-rich CWC family protein [Halieaceae bacterium]|nr:cysteine-rich CWC family protein [Halieaceae bacterium]
MNTDQQWQQTCPLCGGDNRCAMAAGRAPESCWCNSVTIAPAALAAIPPESVGKRCLCPACGADTGGDRDER